MKRAEIIDLFRTRLGDTEAPHLVPPKSAAQYLDLAHAQAARRAKLIRDAKAPLCRIACVAPRTAAAAVLASIVSLQALAADVESAAVVNGDATATAQAAGLVSLADSAKLVAEAALAAGGRLLATEAVGDSADDIEAAMVDLKATATTLADAALTAAVDSADASVVTLQALIKTSLLAAVGDVSLSPLVFEVVRAAIDGSTTPLCITSVAMMDADEPGWESRSAGRTSTLVLERQGESLRARLHPVPSSDCTLRMTVHRYPLGPLNTDDDEPEIPSHYHVNLVDWMINLAHLQRDTELTNEAESGRASARFASVFGPAIDSDTRRTQDDERPDRVFGTANW